MADKVRYTCVKCGSESWFEVDLGTYVVSVNDLVCDNCFNEEDD